MRKYIVYFQGRVFFLSYGQYPFSSKCEENKLKKSICTLWGTWAKRFNNITNKLKLAEQNTHKHRQLKKLKNAKKYTLLYIKRVSLEIYF